LLSASTPNSAISLNFLESALSNSSSNNCTGPSQIHGRDILSTSCPKGPQISLQESSTESLETPSLFYTKKFGNFASTWASDFLCELVQVDRQYSAKSHREMSMNEPVRKLRVENPPPPKIFCKLEKVWLVHKKLVLKCYTARFNKWFLCCKSTDFDRIRVTVQGAKTDWAPWTGPWKHEP
jgi:hypothetical protein